MYAIYTPTLTATAANVLADLVLIFTGTTNTALLSVDCDIANTTILTTYNVAGWTVHDAAAGTNKVVLKAPCAHDATIFKYVSIDTNTAGLVKLDMYQEWDAGTHTATLTMSPNSYQRIALGTPGHIFLFSSVRYIALYGNFGANPGAAGAGTATTGLYHMGFVAETEPTPWQVPGSVYIPAILVQTWNGQIPIATIGYHRRRDGTHTAGIYTSTVFTTHLGLGSNSAQANSVPYYDCDESGQRVVILSSFNFTMKGSSGNNAANTSNVGTCSDVSSIYTITANGVQSFDTFVDHESKVRQVFWANFAANFWAFLRG